jgi:hypothetical protein
MARVGSVGPHAGVKNGRGHYRSGARGTLFERRRLLRRFGVSELELLQAMWAVPKSAVSVCWSYRPDRL